MKQIQMQIRNRKPKRTKGGYKTLKGPSLKGPRPVHGNHMMTMNLLLLMIYLSPNSW